MRELSSTEQAKFIENALEYAGNVNEVTIKAIDQDRLLPGMRQTSRFARFARHNISGKLRTHACRWLLQIRSFKRGCTLCATARWVTWMTKEFDDVGINVSLGLRCIDLKFRYEIVDPFVARCPGSSVHQASSCQLL